MELLWSVGEVGRGVGFWFGCWLNCGIGWCLGEGL